MIKYPPSLSKEILKNCFHASNGEIGVGYQYLEQYFLSCKNDKIALLGWEMWLRDHQSSYEEMPIQRNGYWSGLIPANTENKLLVFTGNTTIQIHGETWNDYVMKTINESKNQISKLDIYNEINEEYFPFICFNFALFNPAVK